MTEQMTVRRAKVTPDDHPALLADVDAYVRLNNAVCSHDTGHDDLSTWTRAEALGILRDAHDRENELFVVERDGTVIAAATSGVLRSAPEAVEIDLMLDPALTWDDDVADMLLAELDRVAARHRLDVVQTWTLHRPRPPRRSLVPSTGIGAIDGADPLAAFLAGRGFTLEQVERNSRFDLRAPLDRVERMLADALAVAGPDYRVVSFLDHCPEELLDSYAVAVARMSTDPPAGGTVVEVEEPDPERVRHREDRLRDQGLTASVTLAVHSPTGEVAAYNELVIGEDRTAPTHQHGTLVLPEHRGHRLGMVVKCEGLLRMREIAPESPAVATFNAEENTHMLAINVDLGFVPASYAGAWKRVSAASGSAGRSGSTGS